MPISGPWMDAINSQFQWDGVDLDGGQTNTVVEYDTWVPEAALNAMREERDKARKETTYWADQYEMVSRGVEEVRDALASTVLDLKAVTEERYAANSQIAALRMHLRCVQKRLAERDASLRRVVRL